MQQSNCSFALFNKILCSDFRIIDEGDGAVTPSYQISKMRINLYYNIFYVGLGTFLTQGLIPLGLMMYYNYYIYKSVKFASSLIQRHQCRKGTKKNQEKKKNQETDLAKVLVGIVITFICTHALRIFINFYEMIVITHVLECMFVKCITHNQLLLI